MICSGYGCEFVLAFFAAQANRERVGTFVVIPSVVASIGVVLQMRVEESLLGCRGVVMAPLMACRLHAVLDLVSVQNVTFQLAVL